MSRGIQVVSVSVCPWAQYKKWTPDRQLETVRLNNLIRQYAALNAAQMRYVDTYTALGDPAEPQRLRPRYDVGDGLHLIPAGDEVIARLIADSVLTFNVPIPLQQSATLQFSQPVFGLTQAHIQLRNQGEPVPVQLVRLNNSNFRLDFLVPSQITSKLKLNLDLSRGPIFDQGLRRVKPQSDALLRFDYVSPSAIFTLDLPAVSAQPMDRILITFHEAVTMPGVSNFFLLRDRINVHPLRATISRRDDRTFAIALDASQLIISGTYQLVFNPMNPVLDAAGNAATRGALTTWVKLDSMPAVVNATWLLSGTAGSDNIEVIVQPEAIAYTINGIETRLRRDEIQRIEIQPGAKRDLVSMRVLDTAGPITLRATSTDSQDRAYLYDSSGDDQFRAGPEAASLSTADSALIALGFAQVTAISRSGDDAALLTDSSAADYLESRGPLATLTGNGFEIQALGFPIVNATSQSGGDDVADIFDSPAADVVEATMSTVKMQVPGYTTFVTGFSRTNLRTSQGFDSAYLVGSSATERFTGRFQSSVWSGGGLTRYFYGFDSMAVTSGGGDDVATLHDGAGNERFVANSIEATLSGRGYQITARNFRRVHAYATAGSDEAELTGSSGDDVYTARPGSSSLSGKSFSVFASGFDRVVVSGNGGNDQANLYDSAGDDRVVVDYQAASLVGAGFQYRVSDFDRIQIYASSGSDTAVINDSTSSDRFTGSGTSATLNSSGFVASLQRFDSIELSPSRGGRNQYLANTIAYRLIVGQGWV